MRVIQNTSPTPRLINSLAPENSPEQVQLSSAAHGKPLFYSNSRVILGIMLAALCLLLFTFVYSRFHPQKGKGSMAPELIAIKPPKHRPPQPRPEDELEPLELSMVHVTAISLGEPALAIINGEQVAEGDQLTLRPSKSGPEINVRVLRIGDGKVELTDGNKFTSAFLEAVVVTPPKR